MIDFLGTTYDMMQEVTAKRSLNVRNAARASYHGIWSGKMKMTKEQIKSMVDRFLSWKLPKNFNPDAGISFKPDYNEDAVYPMRHEPCGTNLFDATQAEAMVRHMIECPNVGEDQLVLVTRAGIRAVLTLLSEPTAIPIPTPAVTEAAAQVLAEQAPCYFADAALRPNTYAKTIAKMILSAAAAAAAAECDHTTTTI